MVSAALPRPSRYDRSPATRLGEGHRVWSGAEVWNALRDAAETREGVPAIAIDCYPGVTVSDLFMAASEHLSGYRVVDLEEVAAKPIAEIDAMIAADLTDDRVFGTMSHKTISDFYDPVRITAVSEEIAARKEPVVVIGWGASRVAAEGGVLAVPGQTQLTRIPSRT